MKFPAFTLIETLIVMAILVIVLSMGLPMVSNFQTQSQVNEITESLTGELRLIAQDSQSGWNNASFGLKFLPGQYVVYQGNDYSARQRVKDRVIALTPSLKIELILATGSDDINFNRQGLTAATGTIKIIHANGTAKILILNKFGVVSRP